MAILIPLSVAVVSLCGCDRKVEPFVPGEQPSQPDLRRIFPPGASKSQEQAGAMAGGGASVRGGPPAAPGADTSSAEPVRGRVSVAPELAGRVPRDAVLFVIARRGEGGPPLAVKRVASPTFPLDFELGPQDRMIQAVPFVGPLRLMARLDSDGNAATRTAGDLQGSSEAAVEPGSSDVEIVLREVL